ncbi:hypothetical protein [Actinoallomurus sp. CA-142502]|uniref:phage major capsid protein n=1 Tax=Actinoallomurus sp. CA-142502 TaxID=3239885 RepID=UPI003D8B0981
MTTSTLFESAVERLDHEADPIYQAFGGDRRVRRSDNPKYLQMLGEAERFMDEILFGTRPLAHFAEAMSTSDFPQLFGDSLDRQLYGAYMATTPTWRNYARAATVNDFRKVKRFATSGIRGQLQKVGELSEYPERAQTETEYEYAVSKYGATFAASWEAMINDDLDMFRRLPQDLADSVVDSEEAFVTGLFCDTSGPNASFFTSGNGNLISGNPPLSRTALQGAITTLMKRKDERGNPIVVTAVELVVGPGLALTAQEIIDTTEYRVQDGSNLRIITGNGLAANLRLNINYWIPAVATSANADTSWWVFASTSSARPAMEFGRLRGYEAPALFEKIPDARRIGGGAEDMVDFATDGNAKKVRHVYGGTTVDPKMSVGSNGSGS